MRLWTTTVAYGATGEGETYIAWIGYAENADGAKMELIKVSNEFHGAFGVCRYKGSNGTRSPTSCSRKRR